MTLFLKQKTPVPFGTRVIPAVPPIWAQKCTRSRPVTASAGATYSFRVSAPDSRVIFSLDRRAGSHLPRLSARKPRPTFPFIAFSFLIMPIIQPGEAKVN